MNKKVFTGCPKCQAEVSRIKYGDMEVEFCPNCKGFFLDAGELSHPTATTFDDSVQETHLDAGNLDKLMVKCPKCGVEMLKHKPTKAGPVLDVCPSCKGVWFDQGEFKRNYKDWKGIKRKKQHIPLRLLCTHCSLKIESKYSDRHKLSDSLKCPKCGTNLVFEFFKERNYGWAVWLLGVAILAISMIWILNYWTGYDARHINKDQPIRVDEMIYGGVVHARIRNSGRSFSPVPSRGIALLASMDTASMVDQKHDYYLKGLTDSEILVEFIYADSKQKHSSEKIRLPLFQGKAFLRIPAIPQLKNSHEVMLTLNIANDGKGILVEQT